MMIEEMAFRPRFIALLGGVRQPLLFGAVGVTNTAIDYGAFIALCALGLKPLVANLIGFTLGAFNSYVLNGAITFRSNRSLFNWKTISRFGGATLAMLAISQFMLWLGITLSLSPVKAKGLSIAATFAIGFIVNKFVVFRSAPSGEAIPSSFKWEWAGIAVAMSVTSIPTMLVRVPPMLDYPNHYARLWLLLGGAGDPTVSHFYRVDWSRARVNIAIDLVARIFSGVASIDIIGPLVLSLAILLPPLGIALLAKSAHGRITWWHILCVLLGWSTPLVYGFLNFEIGLGVAMIAASADFYVKKASWMAQPFLRGGLGTIIAVAHPFGLVFYLMLLVAMEFGPGWTEFQSLSAFRHCLLKAFIVSLPAAMLSYGGIKVISPVMVGADTTEPFFGLRWHSFSLKHEFSVLLTPFKTYDFRFDAIFLAFLLVALLFLFARERARFHAGFAVLGLILAVLALLMPERMLGTGGMDMRLPPMMALSFALAVVHPNGVVSKHRLAAVFIALCVVGARAGQIGGHWIAAQAEFKSMDSALQFVPLGSRILPVGNFPAQVDIHTVPRTRMLGAEQSVIWHYAVLGIVDRHSFIPTLFTAAGKQPVVVLPSYSTLAIREGGLFDVKGLYNDAGAPRYFQHWQSCFDYVLLLNADLATGESRISKDPMLRQIADRGFASVYQIIHPVNANCPS